MDTDIFKFDPSRPIEEPITTVEKGPLRLLPWIKDRAKVTLYLSGTMSLPKQGWLIFSKDGWAFAPGRSGTHANKAIPLPNFVELAQSMVTNKKLFQGWKSMNTVISARLARATSNITARHVSAKDLRVNESPSLIKHKLLIEINGTLRMMKSTTIFLILVHGI